MKGLKFYRVKARMTQAQLADLLGTDVSTVTKWETGDSHPRADRLPIIANTLNCSIEDLFKSRGEPNNSAETA